MSANIKTKLQDVKRGLILEAAAKLFETEGYEQLKVSELARSVGVSVGTIYGLFESKERLYMAYVRAQIGHYLAALDARLEGVGSPEAQLREVFALKFEYFSSKRKAVEECAKNNPLFFSNIRHNEPEILEGVYCKIAVIVRAIRPGLSEKEALELAYQIIGLSDGYLTYWLAHDGDLMAGLPNLHTQMLMLVKECG